MKLLHYSHAPVTNVASALQISEPHFKPQGFWLSVGDSWKKWCEASDFGADRLTHVHNVRLAPGANVMRIKTADELDSFTAIYTGPPLGPSRILTHMQIHWDAVARSYQGIIIAPYIWERRLHDGCYWYYAWDCASGCIWDAKAIAAVTLRGHP